jgi:hypothetical protein
LVKRKVELGCFSSKDVHIKCNILCNIPSLDDNIHIRTNERGGIERELRSRERLDVAILTHID